MNQSSGNRKSRRRFLADVLFLGGGLTAAGLLAKYQLASPDPEPSVAGGVQMPTSAPTPEASGTPRKTAEETIPCRKDTAPTSPRGTPGRKPGRKPADPFVGKVDPRAHKPNTPPRDEVPQPRRDSEPDIMGMYRMPDPRDRN